MQMEINYIFSAAGRTEEKNRAISRREREGRTNRQKVAGVRDATPRRAAGAAPRVPHAAPRRARARSPRHDVGPVQSDEHLRRVLDQLLLGHLVRGLLRVVPQQPRRELQEVQVPDVRLLPRAASATRAAVAAVAAVAAALASVAAVAAVATVASPHASAAATVVPVRGM